MPKQALRVLFAVIPPVLAGCAVALEAPLRQWAHGRPATLPTIMLLIGTVLLNPRLRHRLLIALCYGVSFLAMRDMFVMRNWHLPFPMSNDQEGTVRLFALAIIASLSGVAGVFETWKPGTVWVRRFYFGAAALYCMGLGISVYGPHGSWQAVVLCGTGLFAFIGCLFAHEVVGSDGPEQPRLVLSDEAAQRLRDAEHLRALRDREWQDPAAG